MEILKYCIDTVKDFPLKKYYKIDKNFEYILGIVTKGQVNHQIFNEIEEKSSGCVTYFGYGMIDDKIISFLGLKNIVSSQPLLNSINKYLGNENKILVKYIPSLKEMCINCWGELKFHSIMIENQKIDVRCL